MYVIEANLAGRLAIVPRPRGGDWLADDIARLRAAGIDVLVSLLEPAETGELGLEDEAHACAAAGIEFVPIPVPDREVPANEWAFLAAAGDLRAKIAAGRSVGIHCRACLGRAPMLAATILVLDGEEPERAWDRVETARGVPVPDSEEQRRWIAERIAGSMG